MEFGRLRGVHVLPEFDAPAHVGNGWQFGEKEGKGRLAGELLKGPAIVWPLKHKNHPTSPKSHHNKWPLLGLAGPVRAICCDTTLGRLSDFSSFKGHTLAGPLISLI